MQPPRDCHTTAHHAHPATPNNPKSCLQYPKNNVPAPAGRALSLSLPIVRTSLIGACHDRDHDRRPDRSKDRHALS